MSSTTSTTFTRIDEPDGAFMSVKLGDGEVARFGYQDTGEDIATVWFSWMNGQPHIPISIIKKIREEIELLPHRRKQTLIQCGSWENAKFAELLGFIPEGIIRKPTGEDAWLYRYGDL